MLAGILVFILLEFINLILYTLFRKQAFGAGDSKFLFLIGLWLGVKGMLLTLVISFYLGGSISLVLLFLKRITRKQKIAYAPLLSLSAYLVCYLGDDFWVNVFGKAYPI